MMNGDEEKREKVEREWNKKEKRRQAFDVGLVIDK